MGANISVETEAIQKASVLYCFITFELYTTVAEQSFELKLPWHTDFTLPLGILVSQIREKGLFKISYLKQDLTITSIYVQNREECCYFDENRSNSRRQPIGKQIHLFFRKKKWIKLVDEVNRVKEKLLYGCHNIKRFSFTPQDALVILKNIFSEFS